MKVGTLGEEAELSEGLGLDGNYFIFRLPSPLGSQRLPPQFDLESKLWGGPRDRGGLRRLGEAVVLPLVLLVFFVFALVNAVQAGAALT